MSIAGIRSNRGDVYQTLVAMGWALTVIAAPFINIMMFLKKFTQICVNVYGAVF